MASKSVLNVKVTVLDTWTDDHILCAKVRIGKETIELWWCGWEGLAAARYANESGKAMRDLMRLVKEQKEADAEDKKEAEQ